MQFPTPTRSRRHQVVVDEADKLSIQMAVDSMVAAAGAAAAAAPQADDSALASASTAEDHVHTPFDQLVGFSLNTDDDDEEDDGDAGDDLVDIGDPDLEFESSPLRVDSPGPDRATVLAEHAAPPAAVAAGVHDVADA